MRGIIVRSRNIFATIGAIVEGNITFFTQLREKARTEAFELMVEHAEEAGAKGIIGMRYDANEVMGGVTEVPAYGTAVVPEKL